MVPTAQILKLHSEGYGIDDICTALSLPIAIVEETLDFRVDDSENSSLDVIDVELFKTVPKDEIAKNAQACLAFIINSLPKNVNDDQNLMRLQKINIIVRDAMATLSAIEYKEEKEDDSFVKYLQD